MIAANAAEKLAVGIWFGRKTVCPLPRAGYMFLSILVLKSRSVMVPDPNPNDGTAYTPRASICHPRYRRISLHIHLRGPRQARPIAHHY